MLFVVFGFMMRRLPLLVFVFIHLFSVAACKSEIPDQEEIVISPIDSLTLKRVGSLSWVLDEESVPQTRCAFFCADSGILYFFNDITGKIDKYSLNSKNRISGVKIPVKPWSMNVVSEDSVYVLDLDNSRIVLIDASGKVVDSTMIDKNSNFLPGGSGLPYVIDCNNMAYVASNTRLKHTTFMIDKETQKSESYIPYPGMYEKFYGLLLMQVPYSAYNPQKKCIVVGFAPESSIYIMDTDTHNVEKYHVESTFYKTLTPLKDDRWGKNVSSSDEIEYFRENTTYANILYDEYRNLYYRIVEIATPMPGITLTNIAKKLSVIIMDADFRIVGESVIEEKMMASFRYTCFVSEQGLNLQLLTSEDKLSFATYKIMEK